MNDPVGKGWSSIVHIKYHVTGEIQVRFSWITTHVSLTTCDTDPSPANTSSLVNKIGKSDPAELARGDACWYSFHKSDSCHGDLEHGTEFL